MITREDLEKRLAELRAGQDKLRSDLLQLQQNISAFAGAIEDTEYWLTQVEDTPNGNIQNGNVSN